MMDIQISLLTIAAGRLFALGEDPNSPGPSIPDASPPPPSNAAMAAGFTLAEATSTGARSAWPSISMTWLPIRHWPKMPVVSASRSG